ncbi:MAG: carboxylesterase [Alphaproteobacteria bacterium PA2]|nr:MAG: carboxylesterase [Alphaproteobacteria bacterium PA2]
MGGRNRTGAAIAMGAMVFAGAAQGAAPEVAMTTGGPVKATARGAMTSYFAIPYAAPPVGELRWRAPQPAAKWTAPIAKAKSDASCLQTGAASFRSAGDSEDCLYLDVHRPTGDGPFPVMVWIHGGAFTSGSSGFYADPAPMVTKGVIVVAMNYRLGSLGFLAHPALRDADGSAGNYGIMDQQAALRWVQANIEGFGGDPKNVTIFGESAGGFSVLTHLASPGSAGLFSKAIIESGAYGVSGQLTQAELEASSAKALAKVLEARDDAPATCNPANVTADCLRALPASLVRGKLMNAFTTAVPNIIPSVDGKVLPQTIKATFAAGQNNKVPVINGSNENENTLFIALGELGARFAAKPPNFNPADRSFLMTAEAYAKAAEEQSKVSGVSAADLTGKHYPLKAYGKDTALQPTLASAAAGTDATFSCNGINVSARMAAQGTPVWMYEFRDQGAPSLVGTFGGKYVLSFPQGAAHASELPYLFNMMDVGSADRKALKETMATYWTNFARSGDPNGKGAPTWAGFKGGKVQALDVPEDGGVRAMAASAFRAQHKCTTAWVKQVF